MNARTHRQFADFIWCICDLLRGPYKRNEYRKIILPSTVLRRSDCLLAPAKHAVLAGAEQTEGQVDRVRRWTVDDILSNLLQEIALAGLLQATVNACTIQYSGPRK